MNSNLSPSEPASFTISQALVFFPGTLCDERVFMPCWEYLHNPYQAYVPLQWAEDLAQMMALSEDRLGYFEQPVHLVGFSMGGYIAALTALTHPQRVASLTLIANSCQALPAKETEQRALLLKSILAKKYRGMSDSQIAAMLHESNATNMEIINVVRAMEQDLGATTLAKQISASRDRSNLLDKLARLSLNVHFIAGEQDQLAPVSILKQAQLQVPASRLSIVSGAGHLLPLEQPKQLAALLTDTIT